MAEGMVANTATLLDPEAERGDPVAVSPATSWAGTLTPVPVGQTTRPQGGVEPVNRPTRQPMVRARHTGTMGFNPHRQHKRSSADYVMVAAAVLVCCALVAWAFLG